MKCKSVDGHSIVQSQFVHSFFSMNWIGDGSFCGFYWKLNAFLTANALLPPNRSPLLWGAALFCLDIQASLHCGYHVIAMYIQALPSALM